jgi:predicted DNA binding CopG/RHH family protein
MAMVSEKRLPKFATEAEEATWWYEHRQETSDRFAAAIKDGTVIDTSKFLSEEGLVVETEPVVVTVYSHDAERAKVLAASKGISYEEYLASLVHEGIGRDEAA